LKCGRDLFTFEKKNVMRISQLCIGISLVFSSNTLVVAQALREPVDVESPSMLEEDPKNSIYSFVEEMPVFVKEGNDFNTFVAKQMRYPQECAEMGVEGTVYIRFVVSAEGGVRDIQIMKSPKECQALEKEAIRIVNVSSQFWKAGKQSGKAVNVYYTFPIRFKLQ
jgi:protein TonB